MNIKTKETVRAILYENLRILLQAHVILYVAYSKVHTDIEQCDCEVAMHYKITFKHFTDLSE